MCAKEMIFAIAEDKARREAEELARKQAWVQQEMKNFEKNRKSIENYIEKALIAGNGTAELLIDSYFYADSFWRFVSKSYKYGGSTPYWEYEIETSLFPLDILVKELENLCYNVKIESRPFTARSSTKKRTRTMAGWTMIISIR